MSNDPRIFMSAEEANIHLWADMEAVGFGREMDHYLTEMNRTTKLPPPQGRITREDWVPMPGGCVKCHGLGSVVTVSDGARKWSRCLDCSGRGRVTSKSS